MKRGSGFARWMRAHPATPLTREQAADALAKYREGIPARIALAAPHAKEPLKLCPVARRHGQDEQYCVRCGLTWGLDEPRPTCSKY